MNKLFVINYEGEHFRNDNHENLICNFERDSGVEPTEILEQPSKDNLVEFLKSLKVI